MQDCSKIRMAEVRPLPFLFSTIANLFLVLYTENTTRGIITSTNAKRNNH